MLKGDEKGALARVPFSILSKNRVFDLLKNEFITLWALFDALDFAKREP